MFLFEEFVHCLYTVVYQSWKLSLYTTLKHYLYSTYAYTNSKVRVMKSILATAKIWTFMLWMALLHHLYNISINRF